MRKNVGVGQALATVNHEKGRLRPFSFKKIRVPKAPPTRDLKQVT
nr:D573 [uncultured bacterium]